MTQINASNVTMPTDMWVVEFQTEDGTEENECFGKQSPKESICSNLKMIEQHFSYYNSNGTLGI